MADRPKQTAVSKNKTNKFLAEANTFWNIAYQHFFCCCCSRCHISPFSSISATHSVQEFFFPLSLPLLGWFVLMCDVLRSSSKFLLCALQQNFYLIFCRFSLQKGVALHACITVCIYFVSFECVCVCVLLVLIPFNLFLLVQVLHTYKYISFACVVFWRTKCSIQCTQFRVFSVHFLMKFLPNIQIFATSKSTSQHLVATRMVPIRFGRKRTLSSTKETSFFSAVIESIHFSL